MEIKLSSVLELADENDVKDLVKVTTVIVKKPEESDTKAVLWLNLFRGNEVMFVRSEVAGSVRWVAITKDNGYFIIINTVKLRLLERAYESLTDDKMSA